MFPFRNILCAVDFSRGSHVAMLAAAELAAKVGAKLTVAHAYQLPSAATYGLPDDPRALQVIADNVESALATWKAEVQRVGVKEVEVTALLGAAWDSIVSAASHRGCDLIVVGTHGRTGLAHVLLGSVAEKIVRHAKCPVLVVRAPPESFGGPE